MAAPTVANNSSFKIKYAVSQMLPALDRYLSDILDIHIIHRAGHWIDSSWQAAAAISLLCMHSNKVLLRNHF